MRRYSVLFAFLVAVCLALLVQSRPTAGDLEERGRTRPKPRPKPRPRPKPPVVVKPRPKPPIVVKPRPGKPIIVKPQPGHPPVIVRPQPGHPPVVVRPTPHPVPPTVPRPAPHPVPPTVPRPAPHPVPPTVPRPGPTHTTPPHTVPRPPTVPHVPPTVPRPPTAPHVPPTVPRPVPPHGAPVPPHGAPRPPVHSAPPPHQSHAPSPGQGTPSHGGGAPPLHTTQPGGSTSHPGPVVPPVAPGKPGPGGSKPPAKPPKKPDPTSLDQASNCHTATDCTHCAAVRPHRAAWVDPHTHAKKKEAKVTCGWQQDVNSDHGVCVPVTASAPGPATLAKTAEQCEDLELRLLARRQRQAAEAIWTRISGHVLDGEAHGASTKGDKVGRHLVSTWQAAHANDVTFNEATGIARSIAVNGKLLFHDTGATPAGTFTRATVKSMCIEALISSMKANHNSPSHPLELHQGFSVTSLGRPGQKLCLVAYSESCYPAAQRVTNKAVGQRCAVDGVVTD